MVSQAVAGLAGVVASCPWTPAASKRGFAVGDGATLGAAEVDGVGTAVGSDAGGADG